MKLNLLKKFRKDEEGGILAFFLIMFLMLVVGGGMAVDFMNSEYQREKVQDALDRGVLAAAAIGKAARAVTPAEITAAEAEAVLVVKSYLSGAGYDPEAPGVSIVPNFDLNSQRMAASSDFSVDTFFLRLSGIDSLGGSAASGAVVTQNSIEISLVLDVSGSMANKIAALKVAAKSFTSLMLSGDKSDYTFINLVPFDHGVNVGLEYLNLFAPGRAWHSYSACTYFTGAAFATPAINPASVGQLGHLNTSENPGDLNLCVNSRNRAIFYSNSIANLDAGIDGLEAYGWTAGFSGVKWGMGLLDPSAQSVVTTMIDNGDLPASMAGKPAAYTDDETLKFVVVMSDGIMNYAVDYNGNEYAVATDGDGDLLPAHSPENADYWELNPDEEGGWDIGASVASGSNTGTGPLLDACNTAKFDNRTVVFTIAYGLTEGSAADVALAACASGVNGAGFYYNVDTTSIAAAFASIAATIQQLRLTN